MLKISKSRGSFGLPCPPLPTPMPLRLVIKRKVVKEALQWSGEHKCKVTSIKPNWQANWKLTSELKTDKRTHSCWTALSFEEQLTWWKLHMNWLLSSLSVTTIVDAFLHKDNVCAHDQLIPFMTQYTKKADFTREQPIHPPKVLQKPKCIYISYSHYAWT